MITPKFKLASFSLCGPPGTTVLTLIFVQFLSLGERNTMRLQAVIVKVTSCISSTTQQQQQASNKVSTSFTLLC